MQKPWTGPFRPEFRVKQLPQTPRFRTVCRSCPRHRFRKVTEYRVQRPWAAQVCRSWGNSSPEPSSWENRTCPRPERESVGPRVRATSSRSLIQGETQSQSIGSNATGQEDPWWGWTQRIGNICTCICSHNATTKEKMQLHKNTSSLRHSLLEPDQRR